MLLTDYIPCAKTPLMSFLIHEGTWVEKPKVIRLLKKQLVLTCLDLQDKRFDHHFLLLSFASLLLVTISVGDYQRG